MSTAFSTSRTSSRRDDEGESSDEEDGQPGAERLVVHRLDHAGHQPEDRRPRPPGPMASCPMHRPPVRSRPRARTRTARRTGRSERRLRRRGSRLPPGRRAPTAVKPTSSTADRGRRDSASFRISSARLFCRRLTVALRAAWPARRRPRALIGQVGPRDHRRDAGRRRGSQADSASRPCRHPPHRRPPASPRPAGGDRSAVGLEFQTNVRLGVVPESGSSRGAWWRAERRRRQDEVGVADAPNSGSSRPASSASSLTPGSA